MIIPFGPILVVEDVPNILELQRPGFETLLRQTQNGRDEIRAELNQIYHILDKFKHR